MSPRKAAKDIFGRCTVNGFAFDLEVLILAGKLGKTVSEFPVRVINHHESESKVNPVKDTLKMIRDVSRIKKDTQKPLKFFQASPRICPTGGIFVPCSLCFKIKNLPPI